MTTDRLRRLLAYALALWLVIAIVVVAAGILDRGGPKLVGAVVWSLAIALIVWGAMTSLGRAMRAAIPTRALVALHLTRFVGAYFLVLASRGALARDFAVPAGIGDVMTAVLAVGLLLVTTIDAPRMRIPLLAWNVIGFVDILLVVITALRVGLRDPGGVEPIRVLPLGLLPTFLVPIIIASHVELFARLRPRTP